jgi:hypothetical protein
VQDRQRIVGGQPLRRPPVLQDALAKRRRTLDQPHPEHPLHVGEAAEPEGLGEPDDAGWLYRGPLRDARYGAEREAVRVVERELGDAPQMRAQLLIALVDLPPQRVERGGRRGQVLSGHELHPGRSEKQIRA